MLCISVQFDLFAVLFDLLSLELVKNLFSSGRIDPESAICCSICSLVLEIYFGFAVEMGKESVKGHLQPEIGYTPSAPPGFSPRATFTLRKVSDNSADIPSAPPGFAPRTTLNGAGNNNSDTASETIDLVKLKSSIKNKPWILYNHSNHHKEEEKEETNYILPDAVRSLFYHLLFFAVTVL